MNHHIPGMRVMKHVKRLKKLKFVNAEDIED